MADSGASESAGPPAEHDLHDLEVVASLLDGDLTGAERAAAVRQVAECAACASLEADLRALASATVALPTVARARDFRLTPADAVALRDQVIAAGAGAVVEPVAAATRLTPDMPDTAAHRTHDSLVVAALADRTVAGSDRQRAEDLVATCGLCAALLDDLVGIRTATVTLPTPPRVDDYRLTPDDAARLHGGGWRGIVAAIGSGRAAFTRPLAVGLTTLGLAGLLVATVPSVLTGTTALGPTVGAASAPRANGAAEDSSAGGAGGGGSAGGGSAAGAPAPDAGATAAATPRSVFAPRASGDHTEVRVAAPTSGVVPASGAGVAPVAASGAAVAPAPAAAASGAAPPAGGSSAALTAAASAAAPPAAGSSAPGYNADLSSPQPPSGAAAPAATTQAPLAGSKGAGTGGDHGLAAPVANPLPTSKVAAESETLDEQRAADGGPSPLVLVSAALLVAGLGLFVVQRLGRRPVE